MTTSSVLNKDQMTLVKPDDGVMINRDDNPQLGFDRSAIRQEFAPVRQLAPGQRYVEEGDAVFFSSESDYPDAPTGIGEVYGNVDLVRAVGDRAEIPRYTHGFSLDIEDSEVTDQFVMDMRDGILEMFDVAADVAFLQGLTREDGTTVFSGVFQWLQDNMPSDNIIDCAAFDVPAGDLAGVPANIITREAYAQIDNLYVTQTWDIAAAKPEVWAYWNQYGTFDGAIVRSQWELVAAGENDAGVGVERRLTIPPTIGLPTAPSDGGTLTFDIDMPTLANAASSELSDATDDVMFLIPNHGGDFYEVYEQGSPDHRMLDVEGWRERHEYKWRSGVVYGQNQHKFDTDIARDAVKLENVTRLFESP